MPGDDCLATLAPAKSSGDPASSLGVYERYNKVDGFSINSLQSDTIFGVSESVARWLWW